ncbi:solid-state culture specific ATP-grasp domain-containing protein [Colletotrichum scovillei]|uniref:Solid-state culture specific ATP-grasp domain-containing protein n=1 Tax=Colletotrichum scovillei TaxID=1209932 RepID=A0A9P7U9A2_9PEZI|nr:solid-state culture specific ATP-grasp domain-containing protein [Colletotrichum scovillei]KAG7059638.1 solid-state culture specific ATP-grasp domain-containing protein [Colletotrichum scovillei]KAG7067085.1 solid-state culture specific ATP-grasp domain-containing protein [Colletotrichum scovillei]
MIELPKITLDTTLTDLYRRASPRNADKRIAQVFCLVNSSSELTPNVPRNAKYLYQDSPFNAVPRDPSSSRLPADDDGRQQQRALAVKYLSLIPQRDAFISGNTAVVLFHTMNSKKRNLHDIRETETTLSVLSKTQRPDLTFCPGPSEIPVEEAGIDLIACKFVLDVLESYSNLIFPPETHWFLNSKAALALSGLPTPKTNILKVDGLAGDAWACCSSCSSVDAADFIIPESCTGSRGRWLKEQSDKIYADLESQPLPFVLKNQQTLGGAGTYIINTENKRQKLVQDFRNGVLRKLLSAVTESNAHLQPAALIVSDVVEDPVENYGLTFFVTDDGNEPIFLAASEQMTDGDSAWIGSTINYRRQEQLEKKFGLLVKRVATWLRGYGYVGPAGADVLETTSSTAPYSKTNGVANGASTTISHSVNGASDFSDFHIVDLNVRTSGSMCLPLLRTHFTTCGLWSASSFSISYKDSRDAFIESFRSEFETGRMCVISWYDDTDTGCGLADVAVGAEDVDELRTAMKRVRDLTEQVTF